jgi:hypothetical protein
VGVGATGVVDAGGTGGVFAGFLAQPDPASARIAASDSAMMRGLHFIMGVLLTPCVLLDRAKSL